MKEALWQIDDRNYVFIYDDIENKLTKVEVIFSMEKRNIIEWEIIYHAL